MFDVVVVAVCWLVVRDVVLGVCFAIGLLLLVCCCCFVVVLLLLFCCCWFVVVVLYVCCCSVVVDAVLWSLLGCWFCCVVFVVGFFVAIADVFVAVLVSLSLF